MHLCNSNIIAPLSEKQRTYMSNCKSAQPQWQCGFFFLMMQVGLAYFFSNRKQHLKHVDHGKGEEVHIMTELGQQSLRILWSENRNRLFTADKCCTRVLWHKPGHVWHKLSFTRPQHRVVIMYVINSNSIHRPASSWALITVQINLRMLTIWCIEYVCKYLSNLSIKWFELTRDACVH